MKRLFLLLSACFLFNSSHVLADCKDYLLSVNNEYKDVYLDSQRQRQIRQLRKVALSLHKIEKETLCEKIVEDIELRLETLKIKQVKRQRTAYLKNAKRMSEIDRVFKAEDVIGALLINVKDEHLGNLEGISLYSKTGQIAYVVMSHGGVLGLGEKYIAIPWDKLKWIQEEDIYVLDVELHTLDNAPDIGEFSWPKQVDTSWLKAD